jgi:acetyl esterase/lipase
MRSLLLVAAALVPTSLFAAEPVVTRGIPYAQPANERQMLDVYAPKGAKNAPVVLWIHGGGWREGDKKSAEPKAQAMVDHGYVLVATNYRFVPNVNLKEMTGDIAKSIRWIHDHIGEHGGDGKAIFVMGHSAGAHLAALVCTDDRYLKAEGLSLGILKGCVPLDVSMYDVPKRFKEIPAKSKDVYSTAFGTSEEMHRELSPVAHIAKDKQIPSFLILHVADRNETKVQSHWLADKLKEAGVPARVIAAEGTNHGTINTNLGRAGDPPTEAMWEFMTAALKR